MHLPHLTPFTQSPLYFFTACTFERKQVLACAEGYEILVKLWRLSATHDGWFVGRFMIMPDHVHFFAMPNTVARPRSVWCKMWKSVSSRRISKAMNVEGPIWQRDTFDHILRTADSYAEKWNYVRENPVRAGLVENSQDWPWQGEIYSLSF